MVIDIDGFLDKYDDGKVEEKPKDKTVDLEFQKDVESRISEVTNQANQNPTFAVLKKLYSEMKKFDEDLPKKFLGIGQKGEEAVKQLGLKYSDQFVMQVKNNAKVLSANIISKLNEFEKMMNENLLVESTKVYFEIMALYHKLPNEFLEQKLALSSQIKNRETLLAQKLQNFTKEDLVKIKKNIRHELATLLKSLKPGNTDEIKDKIHQIEHMSLSLPNIFIGSLADERRLISQTLLKAESFLLNDYKTEFEEKIQIINSLKEKYQNHILQKNAKNALLVYNEIILHFKSLPEVFLERKIQVFNQINDLFSSLNQALIQDNVNSFMVNYNSSKVIEEARDYLRRVKHSGSYSKENLIIIKNKLEKLPKRFDEEKKDLENSISHLLVKHEKPKVEHHTSKTSVKKEVTKEPIPKKQKEKFGKSDKALLEEINLLFKKLKASKSKLAKQEIVRKLEFQLDLAPVTDEKRKEMKARIAKEMR